MLALLGSIWGIVVIIFAQSNLVSEWFNPPGHFLTTIVECNLAVPAVLAAAMLLLGLAILIVEYFRKD